MIKILIVEDNPDIIKELIDLFIPIMHGESIYFLFDITICMTEKSAISLYPGLYDYILLDHDLPEGGNGGEVLKNWNGTTTVNGSWRDYNKSTKIIAFSSITINNERLINLGADYSIEKMDQKWKSKLMEIIDRK